jgi:hypothetical protein
MTARETILQEAGWYVCTDGTLAKIQWANGVASVVMRVRNWADTEIADAAFCRYLAAL